MLLYLRDAETGVPWSVHILDDLGRVSVLCTNWTKSCAFPVSLEMEDPWAVSHSSITWGPQVSKYLGVKIYHSEVDIREGNLGGILRALKGKMSFWQSLRLPIMARIALSNMFILLQVLYYFANLPVWITQSCLGR